MDTNAHRIGMQNSFSGSNFLISASDCDTSSVPCEK